MVDSPNDCEMSISLNTEAVLLKHAWRVCENRGVLWKDMKTYHYWLRTCLLTPALFSGFNSEGPGLVWKKYCSWHWLGTCLLAPAVSGGSTLTDACSMLFPSPSTIMTSKPGWHRRPDTHPVLLSRRGLTSNALWFQFKKGWSWCVKAGSEEQCIP